MDSSEPSTSRCFCRPKNEATPPCPQKIREGLRSGSSEHRHCPSLRRPAWTEQLPIAYKCRPRPRSVEYKLSRIERPSSSCSTRAPVSGVLPYGSLINGAKLRHQAPPWGILLSMAISPHADDFLFFFINCCESRFNASQPLWSDTRLRLLIHGIQQTYNSCAFASFHPVLSGLTLHDIDIDIDTMALECKDSRTGIIVRIL
ncbi:hypothetical protein B0H65DRAFT_60306 [Neurospora tetraspora]|uniref:Uncharacterized protein n=1 Tax=Neurospora tetraspora TaxID=94610 RepID=A0AAE0JQC8_9PEZI|nr:hypothetical protein B0H65DRAFT_60306 [Neurospora tetraspora]